MGYIAKVTSKSMVTIPAEIMRKYGIKAGMRVKFVETKAGVLMIPIPKIEDLHGIDRQHASEIIEGIRELEAEHRREAEECVIEQRLSCSVELSYGGEAYGS